MAPAQSEMSRVPVAAYICVRGGVEAIEFYKAAFGAVEDFRLTYPDGKLGHAQIFIHGQVLMMADEHPDFGVMAPPHFGGSPVRLHLEVEDVDAVITRAVQQGCTLLRPPKEEFYGARSGQVACPFGYAWTFSHTREIVPAEEMQRRWAALLASEG